MDELHHWLHLVRAPGMHAGHLKALQDRFGSVSRALEGSRADLVSAGITATVAEQLHTVDPALIESDLRWCAQPGHAFVSFDSPAYPSLLKELAGAPVGLYVRGRVEILGQPQLAIVGTRNPTRAGSETATAFAQHLVACGLIITSGLAAGIDAAAHRGALKSGITIAVCATGLDSVYPRDHEGLAARICEQGALISEFPPGIGPQKFHFPRRNRVISGLCLGTLVVEAAVHSGSLITAKYAADQGREVFAIPGSIHNPLARGCHRLIKQGAKLVESAEDILAELGPLAASLRDAQPPPEANSVPNSGAALDKEYKILLDALGFELSSIDQLVVRTGLKADEVASMLLILELEGRVESNAGAMYSLIPTSLP